MIMFHLGICLKLGINLKPKCILSKYLLKDITTLIDKRAVFDVRIQQFNTTLHLCSYDHVRGSILSRSTQSSEEISS